MRIADRESSEFRMQLAPPPGERYVCFSVSQIILLSPNRQQVTDTNHEVGEHICSLHNV